MWVGHALFHLSTAWSTAWPAVQRVAGDLGVGGFGTWGHTAVSPLLTPDAMLASQVLVLDAGVLLSLYVGWQIACAFTNRAQHGLLLFAPWATVAALLYVTGIWVFLQPMQMRGMVHQ
jgi:hypothetical protein